MSSWSLELKEHVLGPPFQEENSDTARTLATNQQHKKIILVPVAGTAHYPPHSLGPLHLRCIDLREPLFYPQIFAAFGRPREELELSRATQQNLRRWQVHHILYSSFIGSI